MAWKFVLIERRLDNHRDLIPIIFSDKLAHTDVINAIEKLPTFENAAKTRVLSTGSIAHVKTIGQISNRVN